MSTRFDNESQFIRWNEEMASKYDPEAYHLRSNFLIRWIERRRVKTVLRFLSATPHDPVLEVGCGAGNVLEQVPSGRIHGIDLSTFLIKKSQRRLANRRAILARAKGEQLPFAAGKFRKVICTEVLEHVTKPQDVVREMARVAAADAVLVISIPNEVWINRVKRIITALGLARWLLRGENEDSYSSPEQMTDEWHLHSFSLALLKEVVNDTLVISEIQAIPFKFMPLRYVVKAIVRPSYE